MVEIFQNIRKVYDFSNPCEELADYVEFFAESSPEKTKQYVSGDFFTIKMFPSWTPTFYINLGSPYQIATKKGFRTIRADEDILILRNDTIERYNLPTDHIFTVKFFPGGLEAILGFNQVMLIDQIINLNLIMPHSLLESIKQPITFGERIQYFEQYLLTQLRGKKADHYLKIVNDAIGEYRDTGMQLSTTQLAEKSFVSSKTINRYFNRVVGISPKNYFSILRARLALEGYVNGNSTFSPYDYGYYDMSHFYKNVTQFTGQKLSENEF